MLSFPSIGTEALIVCNAIDTPTTIATWVWETIVDIDITVFSGVSRLAETLVALKIWIIALVKV